MDATGVSTIRTLSGSDASSLVPQLAEILIDAVDNGASVSFMAPLDQTRAERFWSGVAAEVAGDRTRLLVAELEGVIVGTVSVNLVMIENQPHRVDISKLLVHRGARGRGVAAELVVAAEAEARASGRTLAVLDTVPGTPADRLYRRLGWTPVGTIPDYALYPDGTPCPTTVFYKHLDERSSSGGDGEASRL